MHVLLEKLFYPIPTKIIYCYGGYQKEFDKLPPHMELVEGFPNNLSDMLHGHDYSLIVLDDLVSQIPNDQCVDLFTPGLHHRGIATLYLTQNIFLPSKLSRMISLNSHYYVIFRNLRDSLCISTLAKQMFPGCTEYLPPADTQKHALENGHLAWGGTGCLRETYLNCMCKRKRSLSTCRST